MRSALLLGLLVAGCGSSENDSEAAVNLARMLDASYAYFKEEGHAPGRMHVCPNDGRPEGETGITPPLDVKCEDKCVPGTTYPEDLFTKHPVWSALGKRPDLPHRFHYNYKWKNSADGIGECEAVVEAYRDGEEEPAYVWRAEFAEDNAAHSGNPVEGNETSLIFIPDKRL